MPEAGLGMGENFCKGYCVSVFRQHILPKQKHDYYDYDKSRQRIPGGGGVKLSVVEYF